MLAVIFLLLIIVYLLIALKLIFFARNFAKRRFNKGWLGALLATLVMYNLVFWDWLPVVLMHKHYCETDAGFWVYQTPEQWLKNNPQLSKQEWYSEAKKKREELISGYEHYSNREWLSKYVYLEYERHRHFAHAISRHEQKLIDARTGQILSKSIEYVRGGSSFPNSAAGLTDYKFWLAFGKSHCGESPQHKYDHDFMSYLNRFIQLAGIKGERK